MPHHGNTLLALPLITLLGCVNPFDLPDEPAPPVVVDLDLEAAIAEFHTLYNVGDFAGLYQHAAGPVSGEISEAQFIRGMTELRETLGPVETVGILATRSNDEPDEELTHAMLRTIFAEESVVGVIRLHLEDDGWRWSRYRVDLPRPARNNQMDSRSRNTTTATTAMR